jgi:hypothetical protein
MWSGFGIDYQFPAGIVRQKGLMQSFDVEMAQKIERSASSTLKEHIAERQ